MALPYFTSTQGVELTKRVKDLENGGGSGGGSLPEIDLKLTIEVDPAEMMQGASWTRTLSSDVIEEINKALSSYRVFVAILNFKIQGQGDDEAELPIICKSLRSAGGETHLSTMDFTMLGIIGLELVGTDLDINLVPLM